MDRLEFLVEERSMAEVLKVLLPRILPASWVLDENYFIRPHEGKSDLKRSIPKKLKGFAQHKEQTTGFIIIQDQDSNDCRQLKQELVALCKANQAPNIKFLVRIVCHELEAWYLGDMKAIPPRGQVHPEGQSVQAAFGGVQRRLRRLRRDALYQAADPDVRRQDVSGQRHRLHPGLGRGHALCAVLQERRGQGRGMVQLPV